MRSLSRCLQARRLIGPLATIALACGAAGAQPRYVQPRYVRAYPLKTDEGVYAYARISPDGELLAYASQELLDAKRPPDSQIINVVALRTKTITFKTPGIDAYWSPDGTRLIYKSFVGSTRRVDIRDQRTGVVTTGVMPSELGDYFSWGTRNGRDIVLTINGNYTFVRGNRTTAPARVPVCGRYGAADRPLLSKDGRRITTFSHGTIVVRNLTNCEHIVDTGMEGAKADFSWDGRYIAFHAPKRDGSGYQIEIVDLERGTVRDLVLPGSSLFPSWTRDGRLCFRYDGDDYRGFIMASGVLSAPEVPLAGRVASGPRPRSWQALFPETPRPAHQFNFVVIWATWSAHSLTALDAGARTNQLFARSRIDANVLMATDLSSRPEDIGRLLRGHEDDLRRIPMSPRAFTGTAAANQIPTTLLFRDDQLVGEKLGAQTSDELRRWLEENSRQ